MGKDKKLLSTIMNHYRMYLILIVLIAIFGITNTSFLTVSTMWTILRQVSMIAIATVGGGMVIIAGGIDISIGGVMSFSTVIASYLMVKQGVSPLIASAAAMVLCTAMGALSGFLVVKVHMPPMICGLSIATSVRGLGYVISDGVSITGVPEAFKVLSRYSVFDLIPLPVVIVAFIYIIASIVLNKTYYGRYVYAVGSNTEAATLSGINADGIRWSTYIVSGFLAGLAGLVMCARVGMGNANSYNGFEMDVLTAAIIGGISFTGGSGKIVSGLIGAIIMAVMETGLVMFGASEYWQQVISGLILAAVVGYDSYQGWKREHSNS